MLSNPDLNACELPQRLDAEEAFRRCTAIAARAQEIENTAKEGMSHLEAFEMEESLLMSFRKGFYPSRRSCQGMPKC